MSPLTPSATYSIRDGVLSSGERWDEAADSLGVDREVGRGVLGVGREATLSQMLTSVPSPTALLMLMAPPCASIRLLAIASPSPLPPGRLVVRTRASSTR